MNLKIKYLVRSAIRFAEPIICTNCGSQTVIKIDQKFFFTRLFECQSCYLQFRHPSDSTAFNAEFYQLDYAQDDGITTELPSEDMLRQMIIGNFVGSPKNANPIIDLWESVFSDLKEIKAIDYGSSWGYMSYQFLKRGIEVQSFEISRPRAEYGNANLGLDIKSDKNKLLPGNNLFYSSHVIEHVPSIADMIHEAKRLLTPDGIFMAECPNGSSSFRKLNPKGFHQGWGLVHPNYLTDKFYKHLFRHNPYFLTSSPFDLDAIRLWDGKSQVTYSISGGQLLIIAKPNLDIA